MRPLLACTSPRLPSCSSRARTSLTRPSDTTPRRRSRSSCSWSVRREGATLTGAPRERSTTRSCPHRCCPRLLRPPWLGRSLCPWTANPLLRLLLTGAAHPPPPRTPPPPRRPPRGSSASDPVTRASTSPNNLSGTWDNGVIRG